MSNCCLFSFLIVPVCSLDCSCLASLSLSRLSCSDANGQNNGQQSRTIGSAGCWQNINTSLFAPSLLPFHPHPLFIRPVFVYFLQCILSQGHTTSLVIFFGVASEASVTSSFPSLLTHLLSKLASSLETLRILVTCDELSLLFPHEKVADWISALEPELVLYRHYLLTLPALQRSQVIAKQIESGLDEYAFAVLVLSTFPHGYFTPTDRNDDGSEKKDKTVALVKEAARCYHENTPELHRAPRGRMHKLNGFMAFRSWICRAFRGATQRHISVLASNVWGEDPNHAQWELLAAAYNLLRDNFNMVDTTLVTFLTYTVNRFFHFPHNPHQYLARLGMIVSRRVNTGPEILYSLMSTPRAGSFTPPATNPTVPVIVEYCRNLNGYVEQIPNSSWPLNHMNGQKPFWAIPGVTDDPFLTTLAESEFDILDIYTEDDGTIPNNRLIHQPYSNWRQQLYHQQFMAAYNSLRP